VSRALWNSLFTFDTSAARAVEDEMRSEFESHIAMIEDELRAGGLSAQDANAAARQRFGDEQRLRRAGRRIKLGERIMLQRINFGVLVVLATAVVWMAVRSASAQRESLAALQQVSERLEKITAASTRDASGPPALSAPSATAVERREAGPVQGLVYITGLVERPGPYQIPQSGVTLRRMLVSAGGLKNAAKSVTIEHRDTSRPVERFGIHEVVKAGGVDPELTTDDVITVTGDSAARVPNSNSDGPEGRVPPTKATPGAWQNYEPSAEVLELAKKDPTLAAAVVFRLSLDTKAADLLAKGIPTGHPEVRMLQSNAAGADQNISRVFEERSK
jgi:hypothetical protein